MKYVKRGCLAIILALVAFVSSAVASCAPGTKPIRLDAASNTSSCEPITTEDVIRSMYWLAAPPFLAHVAKSSGSSGAAPTPSVCTRLTTIGGVTVCEDLMTPGKCLVISVLWADRCDDVGTLGFERHYGGMCNVKIIHFHGKEYRCNNIDALSRSNKNITVLKYRNVKGKKCSNCLYTVLRGALPKEGTVDFLKLDRPDSDGVDVAISSTFDGSINSNSSSGISGRSSFRSDYSNYIQPVIVFPIFAEMYINAPSIIDRFNQIAMTTLYNVASLIDSFGIDEGNAWNMWATRHMLRSFASVSTTSESCPFHMRPLQFDDVFKKLGLNSSISTYHHTFVRMQEQSLVAAADLVYHCWMPRATAPIEGKVPSYCKAPSTEALAEMQRWISEELLGRCHPFSMWVPCDFSKRYDGFVPCRQDLSNHLAEDYAATMRWCDFTAPEASVPELVDVDARAAPAFSKPPLRKASSNSSSTESGPNIRLAFLLTVYTDHPHVRRLLHLLYSPRHYYLLHIDPAGSSAKFNKLMEMEIAANYSQHNNVFISRDVPIVYGASTATMVLTKAMAWFLRRATGWDYIVSLTGSDYPTMPLRRLEWILALQEPPMPFLMAWSSLTTRHAFRLQKTHPVFESDPYLVKSIDAMYVDRGRPMGMTQMEYRSNNFGPPLFCHGQQSFYHLNNRINKSSSGRLDTQWLFPRGAAGRALSYDWDKAPPAADRVYRIWKKSDPATTGIYDLDSVRYIVESEEGRKYWHFFKHMLLASEEHYYISLFYNWNRTALFVQSVTAEMVWNTWTLGQDSPGHGFQTHTHFLAPAQLDIIKGFSKRGMMFARKFNTKKSLALLDSIDSYIHSNASTEAGLYWPGFYPIDIHSAGPQWKAKLKNKAAMAEIRNVSRWINRILG